MDTTNIMVIMTRMAWAAMMIMTIIKGGKNATRIMTLLRRNTATMVHVRTDSNAGVSTGIGSGSCK